MTYKIQIGMVIYFEHENFLQYRNIYTFFVINNLICIFFDKSGLINRDRVRDKYQLQKKISLINSHFTHLEIQLLMEMQKQLDNYFPQIYIFSSLLQGPYKMEFLKYETCKGPKREDCGIVRIDSISNMSDIPFILSFPNDCPVKSVSLNIKVR